jgi:hypothetical protein
MKNLNDTWIHRNSSTHATRIVDLDGKKFLFRYENGNAFENFRIYQYDGEKLNHLADMSDLGINRETSAYHLMSEADQKVRVRMLNDKGINFIKLLNS